jgi:hypothetical protein
MRAAPDAAGPSAPYFVSLEFDPTPSTIARFNRALTQFFIVFYNCCNLTFRPIQLGDRAHCWLLSASSDALLLAWFRRKEFNLVRFVAPIIRIGRTAFYREIETAI